MVFKYHPDNKDNEEEKSLCNKQMMVINGAYSILKDPKFREMYDVARQRGLFGQKAGIKISSSSSSKPPSSSSQTSSTRSARTSADDAGGRGAGFGGAWQRSRSSDGREYDESKFRWEDDFYSEVFEEGWFDEDLRERLRSAQRKERLNKSQETGVSSGRKKKLI
jgi:DnaJ-class molecular chaperone